jgi:methionine-rich copper-binding protein CopC
MQLDAAHSYAALVGTPSVEQPAVLRVEAGDPDSSYIIRKLEGDPSISGDRMPFGGPYLSQATIDTIKQWIQAGAQKPAAAMSLEASIKAVQRFGIASTSPDNESIVSATVPQIIVSFNADIDSTLLNSTTVTLARMDGTPPLPAAIKVAAGNPSAILIKPQTPLTNGTYLVTLQGSLANMNAQALGQDSSFMFTVDTLP